MSGDDLRKDYYTILGLHSSATEHEIRRAYRRMALSVHPDRSQDPSSAERFLEISEAYDVLRIPAKRRAYDEDRVFRGRPRVTPRSMGRDALTWVENFFIQAGGIEAEGPARGALRRFSLRELEDVWHAIAARLAACGNPRQAIQQYALLVHYIHRHPELELPAHAEARLHEKQALLDELMTLCRSADLPWVPPPVTLAALLRTRRFQQARSLIVLRAMHLLADRLAATDLFDPIRLGWAPLRDLSMIDRLEAIAAGDSPGRSFGHGYTACVRCGGWAINLGVGPPRCAACGSRRFALRARDERDDFLEALIDRKRPRFHPQENLRLAAVQQGLERWLWGPVFLLGTLLVVSTMGMDIPTALPWLLPLMAWTGWWLGAWKQTDVPLADTERLFRDEREAVGKLMNAVRVILAALLGGVGLAAPLWGAWGTGGYALSLAVFVAFSPWLRNRLPAP